MEALIEISLLKCIPSNDHKMVHMKKIACLFIYLLTGLLIFGQEKMEKNTGPFRPSHQLGLTIGHEHAFSGRNADNEKEVLVMPFWGLDYNFQFARKFALGIHTDFVMESFKMEKNLGDDEVVERSHPIAPALMGFYKPWEHWSFGLGAGAEFAKEENYFLNRAAVEYGVEIRNGWEVAGSLQYDFRWNAYDTWTIGLGILKSFGKNSE